MLRLPIVLVLTLASATSVADIGDVAVGPILSGAWPAEGRVGATARVGVSDWLAFDACLSVALADHGVAGLGSVGVIAAWDVLAWVPELRLAGGARVAESGFDPRVIGALGVRRYLSLELSLAFSGGAEWSPDAWLGVASVALLWSL